MNFLSKLKFYTIFKILNYGSNLVLNRFLGLVLLSLLTKNLDQYVIGEYFIFINLQTIIVSISMMGIPHLIMKELSDNLSQKISNFFKYKLLLFCILCALIVYLILVIFGNFFFQYIDNLVLIYLSCFMTILNSIFFYFYIASDKIIFANFLEQILKYILLIFFILILFFFKIEIKNNHIILLYFLVNSFIFLIFILLIINNLQTFPNIRKKILEYGNYTKYIFITGITSFCTVINSKIDLLVIDYFLDKTQASLYGVASQLSFIMFLPGIVFVNILMQKTALLIRNKKIKQLNILIDFYRFLLFTISLSFLFIIIFFFEKITILLFTENYLDSYIVFKILAISSLVVTFFSLNDLLLFYSGKEKKILALAFFGVIINILLSFILVPEFGITGSAISLSSSNIFVSLGIFLINLKNNYFFTYAYQILLKKKLWLIKKL